MKMKENPEIEELLNGYIDGELTIRQRTQIRRLLKNDPQIALRLQQLQKCKTLFNSLPAAQAPAGMLDNIKTSLETANRPIAYTPVIKEPTQKRKIFSHGLIAAAAVFVMAAVLSIIFTSTAPPENPLQSSPAQATASAQSRFNGRLELKTSEFDAVNSFIHRMISNNGLSGSAGVISQTNRRVFSLDCDRQQFNRLLNELGSIWTKFDSKNLFVNTELFGEQIAVNAVTVKQIADIASSDDAIALARDFSVINNIAGSFPLRQTISDMDNVSNLLPISKPELTSLQPAPISIQSEKTIHLTIILTR